MLFKTEGLQDRYIKFISDKKAENVNIKDLVYSITLKDYFDRQAEGISRLNTEKLATLCNVEPALASVLEIESDSLNSYTELDTANILRLLQAILNSITEGFDRVTSLSSASSDEIEEDIDTILKKATGNTSEGKYPIVDEMFEIVSNNKHLNKTSNKLKGYCEEGLSNEATEAEQIQAVCDTILKALFAKNNAVDEALLRVKLYNERQKLGVSKLDYTWHISPEVYDKLQTKKYIKNLLGINFHIKKQTGDLYKADKEDLQKIKDSFSSILNLLF